MTSTPLLSSRNWRSTATGVVTCLARTCRNTDECLHKEKLRNPPLSKTPITNKN